MNAIKLSDDPKKSLLEIRSYLSTVKRTPDRKTIQDGEAVGYWQCPDWIDGLHQIADECERIALSFERVK